MASSFLSVAIADVFGSALAGKAKERQELVEAALPFEVRLSAIRCRAGDDLLKRLFESLGYAVEAQRHALDERFPEWGDSPYFTLKLSATTPLHRFLTHLYVLIPVLDNDKHSWVGDDEVQKLLRHGEGWLNTHPEKELITTRYLKYRRSLVNDALARLVAEEAVDPYATEHAHTQEEKAVEAKNPE